MSTWRAVELYGLLLTLSALAWNLVFLEGGGICRCVQFVQEGWCSSGPHSYQWMNKTNNWKTIPDMCCGIQPKMTNGNLTISIGEYVKLGSKGMRLTRYQTRHNQYWLAQAFKWVMVAWRSVLSRSYTPMTYSIALCHRTWSDSTYLTSSPYRSSMADYLKGKFSRSHSRSPTPPSIHQLGVSAGIGGVGNFIYLLSRFTSDCDCMHSR